MSPKLEPKLQSFLSRKRDVGGGGRERERKREKEKEKKRTRERKRLSIKNLSKIETLGYLDQRFSTQIAPRPVFFHDLKFYWIFFIS